MKKALPILLTVFFLGVGSSALALEIDDLRELVGYTLLATTKISGEFEGADPDKSITLDDGSVFTLSGYSHSYSFRPPVAVFSMTLTPEQMEKLGAKPVPTTSVTLYKLIIRDRVYSGHRVK